MQTLRDLLILCAGMISPHLAKDIDILEKAYHRTTKLVPTNDHLPYEQWLKLLDIIMNGL